MGFFSNSSLLSRQKKFNSIYSREKFQTILDQERARADRNGNPFSLIVLSLETDEKQEIHQLIHILKRRIRLIDHLGWINPGHIGVILPGTPHAGSAEFIRDVERKQPSKRRLYTYEIFTYPSCRAGGGISDLFMQTSVKPAAPDGIYNFWGRPIPVWKRIIDIFGAISALILLSPLVLFLAIYIKVVSPGPIFFRQERLGFRGQPFVCWKFRTMPAGVNPEKHKAHIYNLIRSGQKLAKLDDQPGSEIIPFGNILRKLGIDELPQLINIIRGDMSLIGPRPCMVYEAAEFVNWHFQRFDIHPGLTGLWQVSGKNRTTFEEMMRLDIHYGLKRTFFQDMIIFIRTLPAVLRQVIESKKEDLHGKIAD